MKSPKNRATDEACQGRNHSDSEMLILAADAASSLGISGQAIRKACIAGRYQGAKKVSCNGGEGWVIPLSSLPQSAQQAHIMKLAHEESERMADPRVQAELWNQESLATARNDTAAGKPPRKIKLRPVPVNQDELNTLWPAFENAPPKAKQKAKQAMAALTMFEKMELAGAPVAEINQAIREQFGISPATLWRYREAVRGQPRNAWAPLLIPRWKGKTGVAEFSEEAWEYIKQEWGSQSKPDIAPIYRRAQGMATEHGWELPSLDTVERRIRDLPTWWVAMRREGNKALESLYPSQRRDYSSLKLHEMWCSDGRKADVFCRWPDGTVSRPIIVAWMDLRSRVCLGWAVGKVESADLIRLAFKKSAETSHAIPAAALMDNGRGYASKLLTGGTPNRFRFKVKEEDIPGILTMLGAEVCWATPGHGQAKPIESWWRNLAQMDKRSEFQGAYCANRPDAKPEEFDSRKAVPIETYLQLVQEEINAYHSRPHRGDSMDGQSPRQVYDALLPATVTRHPTPSQLRLCLLAAEAVKLDAADNAISLLGNRYWTETLATLRRDRTYVVRFNPEDAREPVSLYDGERFLCEAPLIAATGFRDQVAAKDHNRARNKFARAGREQDAASREMHQAQKWTPAAVPQDAGLPSPKVVRPVRPAMGAKPAPEEDDDLDLSQEEVMNILTREALKKKAASGD